jgi:hypothetical protein
MAFVCQSVCLFCVPFGHYARAHSSVGASLDCCVTIRMEDEMHNEEGERHPTEQARCYAQHLVCAVSTRRAMW